ncbi:MAG: hypothetical protein EOP54_12185 [Sphingobacteriales bacterium]|nr:MAG: hypothetical protein EOP54_12185 [Sphingobacteriales bacterium]
MICSTVDFILAYKRGRELALNCLLALESEKAVQYAYQIYKNNTCEIKQDAVWLIRHLAHPCSFEWLEEFLNDPEVLPLGLALLDQLLWTERIQPDSRTEDLLNSAMVKSDGGLGCPCDFYPPIPGKNKGVTSFKMVRDAFFNFDRNLLSSAANDLPIPRPE